MSRNPSQPDLKRLLRAAKLRVTPGRLDVLEVLAQSQPALDAQQVFEKLDSAATDRVTVYRTLNALVEAGLAHRVDPGDRLFRYSLTTHEHCSEDRHDHEHPHLVCDSCGKVECMDDAQVIIRRREPGRAAAKSATSAWNVKRQSLTVHGTCGNCEAPGRKGARGPRTKSAR